MVDPLSKYGHFIGLKHPLTTPWVAAVFVRETVRLYGIPQSILFNRDWIFMSKFWTELFRAQKTSLKHSTTYHPQTDGQTKVVNWCLETYMRRFASASHTLGANGYHGRSFGTILRSTQPRNTLTSKLFVVMIHPLFCLLRQAWLWFSLWRSHFSIGWSSPGTKTTANSCSTKDETGGRGASAWCAIWSGRLDISQITALSPEICGQSPLY